MDQKVIREGERRVTRKQDAGEAKGWRDTSSCRLGGSHLDEFVMVLETCTCEASLDGVLLAKRERVHYDTSTYVVRRTVLRPT